MSRQRRALAAKWIDLLRSGDAQDYDGDRSRAGMALAVAFVNAGWPLSEWMFEMKSAYNGAALWYCKDSRGRRRDPDRRLLRDYKKAQDYVNRSPAVATATETRQLIGEHRVLMESRPWPGRTGPADRSVLIAMHKMATKANKLTLSASVREVAETAGVGTATASRALRRLQAQGWLTKVADADKPAAKARVYLLQYPRARSRETWVNVPSRSDSGSDTWRMLGRTAAHVYDALAHDPRSAREIAQITGRGLATVRSKLLSLERDGLAKRDDSGSWLLGDTEWCGLAAAYGQAGRADAVRARYTRERVNYREYFAPNAASVEGRTEDA